ncbi:MAG: T9SS type B sorting domain-containing protein [Bacteroidales bacterium]|nr:T9SS type B sorting domain-containing protein [Bacteroidales bacterium]
MGKPATGNSFTITLDRGQTFSLRSNSDKAEDHLGGVFITSDKNIAITISDDSIQESVDHGHWDLVGDQLIPISIAGTKYIAMHPSYGTINQNTYGSTENTSVSNQVFIWPVDEPTGIKINGIAVSNPEGGENFSRGQFHVENISKNGIFIETEHPVIVYQISSYKYELGSAVLPALECTGSKQVSFVRVYNEKFFVQILTKKKNILDANGNNNFKVDNQYDTDLTNKLFETSAISSAGWTHVPTVANLEDGEEWYSFVKLIDKEFTTGDVVTVKFKDQASNTAIYDDELFHLSVLDANGASMSYGYFSSYNSVSLSGPTAMCYGKDVELRTNGVIADWYHSPNDQEPFEVAKDMVTVTEPGKYWVEIPNSNCQSSDPIIFDYLIPDFDLGKDTTVCPGQTVDLEIEALENTAEYSWYVNDVLVPDNNTPNYSHTTSANEAYEIILSVRARVGDIECTHADTIVINAGPDPVITLEAEEAICAGSTLTTVAPEGFSQTYKWEFKGAEISTDTYITPSEGGTYTLTVSTEDGCTLVQTIDVTVNELPTVTLADVMTCVGVDGTLTPVVTSTAASYNFLWFDDSTNPTLTLTEPREDNHLKVTDSNGCEAEASASFGWHAETIFPSDTILICYSNLLKVEIDDSFQDYSWTYDEDPESGGGAIPLNNTTQNANDHILTIQAEADVDSWAGRYYVEATDSHNCPVDSYFDLIITPKPLVDLVVPEIGGPTNDARMCEGDSIKIEIVDPYEGYRIIEGYKWSYRSTEGTILDNISTMNYIVAKMAGTYYVDIEMDNGCGATGEVDVEMVKSPDFLLPNQEVCPGEEITLGITPGSYASHYNNEPIPVRYEWLQVPPGMENTEITNQFEVVSEEATYNVDEANRGYYRLTAFNGQGCFASKFASATSLDETPVNLSDDEICDNESFTLEIPADLAAEGGSYQWHQVTPIEMPHPLGSNYPWELDDLDAGIYTYRLDYTNPNGCSSSGTMTLTVLPAPSFSLPTGEICEGETISITAKDSYVRYEWNGVADDNTYEISASGGITLEVTDENGCITSKTTNVTARPLPVVSLDDRTECPDVDITLSVPFKVEDGYNIVWTLPNGRTVRNTNSIVPVKGNYSVMVADDLGCAGRDEASVNWKEFPHVYFGPNIVGLCPFQLPAEIEAQGDVETWEKMHWHDDLFEDNNRRPASLSDTVNVIRVMNNDNCWSRASQSVLLALPTIFEAGRDIEGCEPTDGVPFAEELDAGVFTLYEDSSDEPGEVPIASYRWYEGTNNTEFGTGQTFLATGSGQYVVEIFDGCWMHTDTFNIDLYPNPTIAGIDSTIYQQVVVFAEGGTEPYSYALNDQEPQDEKTFKNLSNGDYTVYVIDNNGCEASINFLFESSYDIKVPNFFTPNGDGFNDTWVIEGIEKLPESIIYIYDRYGKLLKKYGSNDPAWNGEYLNQPVPSDDYWYVIHLLPVNKYIKGNFTLKR